MSNRRQESRGSSVQEKTTRGSSSAAPRKVRFNVGNTYHIVDVIGEGAYGVVVSAVHRPSNTKVAIKKIAPFDHSMFTLRTLRELKLLKYFADEGVSENVSEGASMTLNSRSLLPDHYHSRYHQAAIV
jgi:mitogen-activated protein kinase 1/3